MKLSLIFFDIILKKLLRRFITLFN